MTRLIKDGKEEVIAEQSGTCYLDGLNHREPNGQGWKNFLSEKKQRNGVQ